MAPPTTDPAQVSEGDVVSLSNIEEGSLSHYLNLEQIGACGVDEVIHN